MSYINVINGIIFIYSVGAIISVCLLRNMVKNTEDILMEAGFEKQHIALLYIICSLMSWSLVITNPKSKNELTEERKEEFLERTIRLREMLDMFLNIFYKNR